MNTDKELVTTLLLGGVAGLFMGIGRGIVQARHDGWFGFIRGIVASVVVAEILGLALASTSLAPSLQIAIIGASAFVADDVILAFGVVVRLIASDPIGFFSRFFQAYRNSIGNAANAADAAAKGSTEQKGE